MDQEVLGLIPAALWSVILWAAFHCASSSFPDSWTVAYTWNESCSSGSFFRIHTKQNPRSSLPARRTANVKLNYDVLIWLDDDEFSPVLIRQVDDLMMKTTRNE